MQVILNHENMGDQFFHLDGMGPQFTRSALESMGLVNLPDVTGEYFDNTEYISLDTLKPGVSYRIDEHEVALHINASPGYFGLHSVGQSDFTAPKNLRFANQAVAYLNYSVDFSYDHGSKTKNLNLPLELVAHKGNISGYSSFIYRNNERDSHLTRLMSSVTIDNRDSMTRLTLGDFDAYSGRLGGNGVYGGISYSRTFSINPYFNRYTGLLIDGTANTPSQVEYFLGEQLLFSQNVPPGQFVFQNMTPPAGSNRTRMVITDALGNTTVSDGEIYFASRLLKPGVHEFSYNAGFRREGFGRENASYEEPAALGFHRIGVNRNLTLGARGELNKHVANVGGGAQFSLARFGQASLNLSASSADSQPGYAVAAGYQFVSSSFNVNILFRTLSRDYANVSLKPETDRPRNEWLTGVGFNSWDWGSWTASYSVRELHGGTKTTIATASWSRLLGRFGSLQIRYQRTAGDLDDRRFFVGINRPFGFGRFAAVEYRRSRATSLLSARVSKNRSFGPGLGYDLNIGLESGDPSALFSTEYGSNHGVHFASYRRVKGNNAFRIGTTGSVSWIGGKTFFSRPVRDSFALVEVKYLPGVDVLYNNQFIGKTNQDGLLLAPGLNPYYGNRLSINDQDIPVNYELPGIEQLVATPFRGGGRVSFKARRTQAFTGMFFIIADGKRQAAEYWGLRYSLGDESFESVVGKSGVFYIENIPAGLLPLEIFNAGRACQVTLVIPDSPEMYVEIGEVDCEITN